MTLAVDFFKGPIWRKFLVNVSFWFFIRRHVWFSCVFRGFTKVKFCRFALYLRLWNAFPSPFFGFRAHNFLLILIFFTMPLLTVLICHGHVWIRVHSLLINTWTPTLWAFRSVPAFGLSFLIFPCKVCNSPSILLRIFFSVHLASGSFIQLLTEFSRAIAKVFSHSL